MTVRRSLILALAGVVLVIAGIAASYVKYELAEPEPFGRRAVAALRTDEVRRAIAEQVAVQMVERGSPNLVASRPLVLTGVEAVLETEQFARVVRRAAAAALRVLLHGDRNVVVELEEARRLLVPAVRSVSPQTADQIPADLKPRIAELRSSDLATTAVRWANGARAAALPLVIAGLLTMLLAVALSPDRRRTLVAAGMMLAAGAAVALGALTALRAQTISHANGVGTLSTAEARTAAGAVWDAMAGGLETWLTLLGGAGIAVSLGGLLAEARVDRRAALRRGADLLAGGELPRPLRLARGLALAGLGALVLLRAQPLFAVVVGLTGGLLLVLGLAEALALAPPSSRAGPRRRRPVRPALVIGGLAVVLAAGGAALALTTLHGAPSPPAENEISKCNGIAALCDRRLDEVALAGTHNSMSAADRPGWYFANQVHPIPRQLEDGIRLLMIDAHYGVVDAQGRVRTDLAAEGSNRNRAAAQLGPEGVRVAERLAGRLGLVPRSGERRLFLCHTLCELGAERLGATLNEVRSFLEQNPAEVLVILVESSVDPEEIESAVGDADLEPYLATLPERGPLPTLREMIASGRRLVVLDGDDGGSTSWYRPEFLYLQDTRIDSLLRSRTACEPNRGSPDSPLLLMNHWIDRFPPPPVQDREVGARQVLLRRARECARTLGRVPNLIAVDFYERSDVVAVARSLNRGDLGRLGRGPRVPTAGAALSGP